MAVRGYDRGEVDRFLAELADWLETGGGEGAAADGNRRKADVESVISDLEQRRDAVLAELERLASGIAGTATEHRGPKESPEPSADPAAPGREAEEADGSDSDETTVLARD